MPLLLSQIQIKQKAWITSVSGGHCEQKLRHLGLHEGLQVCVLSKGDPAIIYCHHSRVALCQNLLQCITVDLTPRKHGLHSKSEICPRHEDLPRTCRKNSGKRHWLHRKCRNLLTSLTPKSS